MKKINKIQKKKWIKIIQNVCITCSSCVFTQKRDDDEKKHQQQTYEHIGDRILRGQIVVVAVDIVHDDDDIDDCMRCVTKDNAKNKTKITFCLWNNDAFDIIWIIQSSDKRDEFPLNR